MKNIVEMSARSCYSRLQACIALFIAILFFQPSQALGQKRWKDAQAALESNDFATAEQLLKQIVDDNAANQEGASEADLALALTRCYSGLKESVPTCLWFKKYLKTNGNRYWPPETVALVVQAPFWKAKDYETVTTIWKIVEATRTAQKDPERAANAKKGIETHFKLWIAELVAKRKVLEAAAVLEHEIMDLGAARMWAAHQIRLGFRQQINEALAVGPRIDLASAKLQQFETFRAKASFNVNDDEAITDADLAFDVAVARSDPSAGEKALTRMESIAQKVAISIKSEQRLLSARIKLSVLKGDPDRLIKAVRDYDDWSQVNHSSEERLRFLLTDAALSCWLTGLLAESENYFQLFKAAKPADRDLPADLKIGEAELGFMLITKTGDATKIKNSLIDLLTVLKDVGQKITQEQIDQAATNIENDATVAVDLVLNQQAQAAQLSGQWATAVNVYRQLLQSTPQKGPDNAVDWKRVDNRLNLGVCLSNLGKTKEATEELWRGWEEATKSGLSLLTRIGPLTTLATNLLDVDSQRSLEVTRAVNKAIPPTTPGRVLFSGVEALALDKTGHRRDALRVAAEAVKSAKVSLSSMLSTGTETEKRSNQEMLAQTMSRLFALNDGETSVNAGLMLKGIILASLEDKISRGNKGNNSQAKQAATAALSITCADIQSRLPKNVAVVDYMKTPNLPGSSRLPNYGAVVITKNYARWVELNSSAEIDSKAEPIRLEMQQGVVDGHAIAYLKSLYDLLWRKIEKEMPHEISRVIVCPDGLLNNLPFAMLMKDDGSFLVQHYEIAYASSCRDVMQERNWTPIPANPSLLSVCATFPNNPVPMENRPTAMPGGELTVIDNATEHDLRTAQGADIVHISTHGEFLEGVDAKSELDRSVIWLTGGDKTTEGWRTSGQITVSADDNVLSADEIVELNLHPRLIFLACCLSGSGDVVKWEGKFGFRRAFTLMGAGTAITTLWEISAKFTSAFVPKFYETLAVHPDPVAALAITQRQEIEETMRKAPSSYEGSLDCIGNVGPFIAELQGF